MQTFTGARDFAGLETWLQFLVRSGPSLEERKTERKERRSAVVVAIEPYTPLYRATTGNSPKLENVAFLPSCLPKSYMRSSAHGQRLVTWTLILHKTHVRDSF